MIISPQTLIPRLKKGELITDLDSRELENPEGAGFDLRVGEVHELLGGGELSILTRKTSPAELKGKYESTSVNNKITLVPSKYYLLKTIENFDLDENMVGIFHPRSTLFRCGVTLQTGVLISGYKGAVVFGCYTTTFPFELELGSRIAHINILLTEKPTELYRGQWNGGRVSANVVEKQK